MEPEDSSTENARFYDDFMKDSHIEKLSLNYPKEHQIKIVKLSEFDQLKSDFRIKLLSICRKGTIAEYRASFRLVKIYIRLLNLPMSKEMEGVHLQGDGIYGSFWQGFENVEKDLTVKLRFFEKITPEEIQDVVREVAICKLCSSLAIGPNMNTKLPFDIVVYSNAIQFQLEQCGPAPKEEAVRFDKEMKENLAKLHYLKLIHKDIKPANIVWSKAFKKFVFSDFAIAQFVSEPRNEKTSTCREGTLGYMSPEMDSIGTEDQGTVDLYYNDAFALSRSLINMQAMHETSQEQLKPEPGTPSSELPTNTSPSQDHEGERRVQRRPKGLLPYHNNKEGSASKVGSRAFYETLYSLLGLGQEDFRIEHIMGLQPAEVDFLEKIVACCLPSEKLKSLTRFISGSLLGLSFLPQLAPYAQIIQQMTNAVSSKEPIQTIEVLLETAEGNSMEINLLKSLFKLIRGSRKTSAHFESHKFVKVRPYEVEAISNYIRLLGEDTVLLEALAALNQGRPVDNYRLENFLSERVYAQSKLSVPFVEKVFADLKDAKTASWMAAKINESRNIGRDLKEYLLLDLCRTQHRLNEEDSEYLFLLDQALRQEAKPEELLKFILKEGSLGRRIALTMRNIGSLDSLKQHEQCITEVLSRITAETPINYLYEAHHFTGIFLYSRESKALFRLLEPDLDYPDDCPLATSKIYQTCGEGMEETAEDQEKLVSIAEYYDAVLYQNAGAEKVNSDELTMMCTQLIEKPPESEGEALSMIGNLFKHILKLDPRVGELLQLGMSCPEPQRMMQDMQEKAENDGDPAMQGFQQQLIQMLRGLGKQDNEQQEDQQK